jgi:hypothetical protein
MQKNDKTPATDNAGANGEEWWNLSRVLDWRGLATRFPDKKDALSEIACKIAAKEIRALVRSCAWEDGQMVARGPLGSLSAEVVGNFEFKRAPDGEWVLVELGHNPFAPNPSSEPAGPAAGQLPAGTAAVVHVHDEASAGYIQVSLNAIHGGCDIRLRRDEVMAVWPDPEIALQTPREVTSEKPSEPKRTRGAPSQDSAEMALNALFPGGWPSSVSKETLN